MGAGSSSFSQELRTPTRTLHSRLELHSKSGTFTYSQEMKKGVGEEQTLTTRVLYTGRMQELCQDVKDTRGRTIKGNPLFLLHTERVHFDVEWGPEWFQSKKGRLIREDLLHREKGADAKRKCTPIVTSSSTSPPPHPHLHPVNVQPTAPPSPLPPSNNLRPLFSPVSLPPPADSIPRGFSHSAPLSPAPLSLSERQRSHVDTESGGGPVQSVTSDRGKSTAPSNPSSQSTSSPAFPSSIASVDSGEAAPFSFLNPSQPRSITITHNGQYHVQLQQATSLEEMTELLQKDGSDWVGSFSTSALVLRVELYSEEVHLEYFRPKFEYLWAQVQDECPVIMALSNVFHDSQLNDMYLPKGKA